MVTDAQNKASAKYKSKKVKQVNVPFFPAETYLYDYLCLQENKAGFIKGLIAEDYKNNQERAVNDVSVETGSSRDTERGISMFSNKKTRFPKPFVKWAGGKRQLLVEIFSRMPEAFGRYFEPFVGGGAVFFELLPDGAVINDVNEALINLYNVIKSDPESLMSAVDVLDNGHLASANAKTYYYEIRERFNASLTGDWCGVDAAALFLYVNKHCFNGLYRVNSRGLFNVPFNGSNARSYTRDNILAASCGLQSVTVLSGDFESACTEAKSGDFVFFDSPYAPLNPTSFESYTKEGFAKEEHERLAKLFAELTDRGCYCMLTNHDTDFIHDLYSDYKVDIVSARRSINSDASKRTGTEVIVTNF